VYEPQARLQIGKKRQRVDYQRIYADRTLTSTEDKNRERLARRGTGPDNRGTNRVARNLDFSIGKVPLDPGKSGKYAVRENRNVLHASSIPCAHRQRPEGWGFSDF